MDNSTQLESSTILSHRPFTHPQKSLEDLSVLRQVVEKLRLRLSPPGVIPHPEPPFMEWQRTGEHDCRIVVANPERLWAQNDLSLVGFFGQKRADADPGPLDAIDEELMGEFPQHPGVLSYCSQQLEDGNWANLVVLGYPEAREHWRNSARHAYAVRELAPGYYRTLRLHNASLPGGLFSGHRVLLQRTKYYDFQDRPTWYAVREF